MKEVKREGGEKREEELWEVKWEGGEKKGRGRREEKLMDRWESNWGNMTESSRTHAHRD